MTDTDTIILRSLAALLTGMATIMNNNEMEEEAKVLNEWAVEAIGHVNRKQNEAAYPSKFITDAVRDLENRPWPSDLNAGKERRP